MFSPTNFSHILLPHSPPQTLPMLSLTLSHSHNKPFPHSVLHTLQTFSLIDPSNTPPQTLPTFSPNTLPMFYLIKPAQISPTSLTYLPNIPLPLSPPPALSMFSTQTFPMFSPINLDHVFLKCPYHIVFLFFRV